MKHYTLDEWSKLYSFTTEEIMEAFIKNPKKKDKQMNQASILTEKIWCDGKQCRRILAFINCLKREDLPEKYLDSYPSFFLVDESIKYNDCRYNRIVDILKLGLTVSEEHFKHNIEYMRKAGKNLAKIRKEIKNSWTGTEKVFI